ncbi:MAG: AMP-binding protein [Bacteroidales bacterium]|nr:AMP-binding protein [Bacteroidales bacterium]
MNAFDYFFEKTASLEKKFLVGKEEISFNELNRSSLELASWLNKEVGHDKHIILISVNNVFFLVSYLAIIKSGNICIPLDPSIEKENFSYISELTDPAMLFFTRDIARRLETGSERIIFRIHCLNTNPE